MITKNYMGKQVPPWIKQLLRLTVVGTQALGMNPGSTTH